MTMPSILVYEDDPGSSAAFSACLGRAQYKVHTAAHFGPALAILDKERIDLLLADIVMPGGVNGFAMARMAQMRHPRIKVVYLTGYDVGNTREAPLGPVLRKPISDELLLDEISRALAAP